jgi:hypothetical protein
MALLVAEGEQPGLLGYDPLELEVAGRRVAVVRLRVRARGRRVMRNMVFKLGLILAWFVIWDVGGQDQSFFFRGLCVEELEGMGVCWIVYLYQVAGIIEPLRVEVEALRGPTSWSFMLSVGHGFCVRLESRILRIRSPDNIHAYRS